MPGEKPLAESPLKVVAGVIVRAGQVLVCQRPPYGPHPQKWEFPGGKVEAGESASACLRRELEEELGIEVRPGRELWRSLHQYAGGPLCEVAFLRVDDFTGALVNRCFANIQWAAVSQLTTYDFLAADQVFARLLFEGVIPITP